MCQSSLWVRVCEIALFCFVVGVSSYRLCFGTRSRVLWSTYVPGTDTGEEDGRLTSGTRSYFRGVLVSSVWCLRQDDSPRVTNEVLPGEV